MNKSEALEEALQIVTAQATTRPMTEDEIVSMVRSIAGGILALAGGEDIQANADADQVAGSRYAGDPKKSIREVSITCLECGKSFKVITKRHLATHGLTAADYRAKHGFKKGQPLACKALARERRKKMKEMKLWERRGVKAEMEGA